MLVPIIAFLRCFLCHFYTPGMKFEPKIMGIIETTKYQPRSVKKKSP
jgi:hypothetical protein